MVKNRRFADENAYGTRHLQIFLLCTGLTVGFAMRVNLSVAVVAMADLPEFQWSEKIKALVLSSFFWGYLFPQLPAGPLARKYGGKVMILAGLAMSAVLNVLTPMLAYMGNWKLICAVRLLEGLGQGVLFPSVHTVISAWVLPKERASMGNFTYAGNQFGTIAMLASSGLLASIGGWPLIFYASGGAGCIWSVVYFIWGASSPKDSKTITAEERELIEMAQAGERSENAEQPHSGQATPWKSLFTSRAVLALVVVQSSYAYGYWTMLTQIPSYMKNVLDKDIKANALLSALPYTAMLCFCFFFAWISKLMQNKDSISLSFNRKFFNTIGMWIPMCLLIGLGYVPKDNDTLAVVLLTSTVGITAATHVGFLINHIDLTPNFAGILMGICNAVANVMSLLAPLLVGVIVTDKHDASQWRWVFVIAAGVYFTGNSFFLIFGRTSVQSWNEPPTKLRRNSTAVLEAHKV
ncbi:putative inorganic phosphate cotransporter [Drosophila busckii]|uniref:putative inorganic phosphate cotransporter n=1 Tax=Drosophila busckii TaxID=30019 RepID=UPI00083EE95E|nr:putative inorganic phosphate cotransporter [Drosophila busckii]